jgi:hypothetical protein
MAIFPSFLPPSIVTFLFFTPPGLIVCAFLFILCWLFLTPYIFVRPGTRVLIWNRFGMGTVKILKPGFNIVPPLIWGVLSNGPFRGLVSTHYQSECPAPGSRVLVDPPKCEIRSRDGVAGFANIAAEATVTEWTAEHVVGQNILFMDQAKTIINQWMGRELSELDGISMSNYSIVTTTLNNPERLERLNVELKRDAMLEARRVSIDSSGIQLVKSFENNLEKEMSLRKQADLRRLEADAALEITKRKLELQRHEAENERDCAKIKAEAEVAMIKAKHDTAADQVRSLIAAGLPPPLVANILAIEIANVSVSKARNVIVNMPPGLMGLRGAATNIYNQEEGSTSGFEKVD